MSSNGRRVGIVGFSSSSESVWKLDFERRRRWRLGFPFVLVCTGEFSACCLVLDRSIRGIVNVS